MVAVNIEHLWRAQQALFLRLLLILNICGVHSRPYHSYAKLHVVSSDTGGPAMVHVSGAVNSLNVGSFAVKTGYLVPRRTKVGVYRD